MSNLSWICNKFVSSTAVSVSTRGKRASLFIENLYMTDINKNDPCLVVSNKEVEVVEVKAEKVEEKVEEVLVTAIDVHEEAAEVHEEAAAVHLEAAVEHREAAQVNKEDLVKKSI